MQTTLCVGEAHLKQGGNETTGRDVVTSHNPALLNHLLNSHECVTEVFGVLDGRNVVTHFAQTLSKGRTAKVLLVEREIDMIE